mgnify:CR=1 FL=1
MKAIILAAGRGSRMGESTQDKPKCMVEVRGRTLLDWQLDACRQAGITDIGVVTGYRKEAFTSLSLSLFENPRWAQTNMVSSLICAESWLAGDDCIVSYADIFYEPGAGGRLIDAASPSAVLYDVHWQKLWEARFGDIFADAETFRIDAFGYITEIGNRTHTLEDIQGQYMGLLRFSPAGWKEIANFLQSLSAAEIDKLSMTALLQKLITHGVKIKGMPYDGLWGEVDTVSDQNLYKNWTL